MQWSAEAVKQYPTIASACQGLEERDGKTYVKFEGKVAQNIDRGKQLKVDFKDGGQITLTPNPDVTLYVDGRKTAVKDLARGDSLKFYVPEDRFVAQFPQENSQQLVMVPILYREYVREEQTAAVLPSTATNLPLLAMVGFVLVALGGAMTASRRRR